jgi:hypothetical protein
MGAPTRHAQPTWASRVLPDSLEERMTHLALGGLRPVLDLGQQLGLDPDTPMRDALAVGLGFPDQRLEPRLSAVWVRNAVTQRHSLKNEDIEGRRTGGSSFSCILVHSRGFVGVQWTLTFRDGSFA